MLKIIFTFINNPNNWCIKPIMTPVIRDAKLHSKRRQVTQ